MTSNSNLFGSTSTASNSNRYSDNLTIWSHISSNLLEKWIKKSNENSKKLIIIDSRELADFNSKHIKNSLNIPASKIVAQQLKSDKISINELLIKYSNQDLISSNIGQLNIVVYDQKSEHTNQLDFESSFTILLLKKLANKYKSVSFLIEGFDNFNRMYPNLCEGASESSSLSSNLYPILPLNFDQSVSKPKHLRLNHSLSSYVIDLNSSSNSAVSSASSLVSENEPKLSINYLVSLSEEDKQPINEPTKILDFLYLGSQENALDQKSLEKLGITYVLNVSITCPKAEFIKEANFLRIPINDGHSAKIKSYFDVAFKFIEKCRKSNEKVLIHCLAGISRSPTLAIAYLMKHMNIISDEAFKFVKDKRSSISPNFNFLGQLYEYEKQLINNGVLSNEKIKTESADSDGHIWQNKSDLFSSSKKKIIYDFIDRNFVVNKPCRRAPFNLQSPSSAFSKFNLNSPIAEKQSLSKSFTCNSIVDFGFDFGKSTFSHQINQTGSKANVVMRRPTNLSLLDTGANRLKRPFRLGFNFDNVKSDSIYLPRSFETNVDSDTNSSCVCNKTSTCSCAKTESNKKKLKLCETQGTLSGSNSPLSNYTFWNMHMSHKFNNDMNIKSNELRDLFSSCENLGEEIKNRNDSISQVQDCENNENSLLVLNANKSNSSSSSSNKNSLHGSTETMIEVL